MLNLWSVRGLFPSRQSANSQGTRNFKNSVCCLYGICSHENYSELEKLQKIFLWNSGTVRIKHSTLINEYEDGGRKNEDIEAKTKSYQAYLGPQAM